MYALKNIFAVTFLICVGVCTDAQSVSDRLQTAYAIFETDSQLQHAMTSLYVTDEKGNVVFEKNAQTGLAPASTQKIFTAAAAYGILGKDYRYKTYISYDTGIKNHQLAGNLYLEGNGDPTLGSFRWKSTSDTEVFEKITGALRRNGISRIHGDLLIDDTRFGINPTPGGWTWEDMGNYYGAGSWGLNWRENQYDLVFRPSAATGEPAVLIRTKPFMYDFKLNNLVRTAGKGSGDNGYVYTAPYAREGFVTGSIPQGDPEFTISGSMPRPSKQMGMELMAFLQSKKIIFNGKLKLYSDSVIARGSVRKAMMVMDSIVSPSMDSMIYYFLQKSINLYGETLLKTFSREKFLTGDTEKGIEILQQFWKQQGILPGEINIIDGSGLSPSNRVTTHAQVSALLYAKNQTWYHGFYDALPLFNGMKMKSGTIQGVKGFCGYQRSKDGKEYFFSFLVNNYSGSSSALVQKMYKVLNELK